MDTAKDEPINILRAAIKGFDIANPEDAYTGPDTKDNIRGTAPSPAELEAWKNPKHPSRPELKLLDAYPILPDLDATTDSNAYMVARFTSNPTQSTDTRDTRMDVGLLQPLDLAPEVEAEWNAKMAAHRADPVRNPRPSGPSYSYSLYLPEDESAANSMAMKFDVDNPDRDDPLLCTRKDKNGLGSVSLNHIRTYDTAWQSGTPEHLYKEVVIAIHDPDLEEKNAHPSVVGGKPTYGRLKKAAYYYPIVQRINLKPRRNKNLAQLGLASRTAEGEEDKIDVINLTIREPNEIEVARRSGHRMDLENRQGKES